MSFIFNVPSDNWPLKYDAQLFLHSGAGQSLNVKRQHQPMTGQGALALIGCWSWRLFWLQSSLGVQIPGSDPVNTGPGVSRAAVGRCLAFCSLVVLVIEGLEII